MERTVGVLLRQHVPGWTQQLVSVLGEADQIVDGLTILTVVQKAAAGGDLYVLSERWDLVSFDYRGKTISTPLLLLPAARPSPRPYLAMEFCGTLQFGRSSLVNTIGRITSQLNPGLHIEGIIRTMYDPRNSLTRDVSAQLINHFGDKVYRTIIPRNVRLAEAPSYGVPILFYDKQSRGARAYLALAGEIVRRCSNESSSEGAVDGD